MNKSLAAFAVAGGLSLSTAASATVWQPTDGDINAILVNGGGSLALFDNADTGYRAPLAVTGGDAISISESGGAWTAANGAAAIDLGDSDAFRLASSDGASWFEAVVEVSAGTHAYQLAFQSPLIATIVDLQPIPLPGAALLFGSAALGLGVIARRRRRDGTALV